MDNGWDMPVRRQKKIIELVRGTGHVRVNELSELFDVADITIRRDLAALEKRGALERVHGGAVPLSRLRFEKAFTQKYQHNAEIKLSLAHVVPQFVEEGDIVCINAGSTMLTVMQELINLNIMIFTNNGGILHELDQYSARLNILGGYLRPETLAIVGPGTIQQLDVVYPTKTILGVDGFNIQSGLTGPSQFEAEVSRKMISQTRGDVILVADHSKIGVISSFSISGIDKVDKLICDDKIDDSYRQSIEDAGIEVILVPSKDT